MPTQLPLPSALNLQNRFPSSSNRDILEIPALHLELNPNGGDECPRPQGGIDGPALLHGLSSARGSNETTGLRPDRYSWIVRKMGVRAQLGR
jgi:hypothetical protein